MYELCNRTSTMTLKELQTHEYNPRHSVDCPFYEPASDYDENRLIGEIWESKIDAGRFIRITDELVVDGKGVVEFETEIGYVSLTKPEFVHQFRQVAL